MTLAAILSLVLILLALRALGLSVRPAVRQWLILGLSIVGIYWLSPAMPIRNLDFWLPTASIVLCYWVWLWSQPAGSAVWQKSNLQTLVFCAVLVLALGLTRYLPNRWQPLASRAPGLEWITLFLLIGAGLGWAGQRFGSTARWAAAAVWGILLLLFALKFAPLAQGLAFWLRWVMQQDLKQALPTDVRWLGFSYLAFRLVHALRERTTNPRWQAVSLAEFLSFALFLPAWVAGPIDKLPRFVQDLRQPSQPRWANAVLACQRLTVGIAKKFGFAALLSLFALNPQLAEQVRQPAWLWVMLLGYGLYLYCDFSGYTDIALGLALLFDLRLPENFGSNQQQPYRQGNLTQFWNQWHISLAQWFRAYYFNPLSKQLRQLRLSPAVMIAIAQISTMLLIGIWHGVTWNFAIWGLWHGVALFCHNRWVDYCRQKQLTLGQPGWQQRAIGGTFTLLTFVYVNLGWVWFALPSFSQSWLVLRRLFGLG